MGRHTKPKDNNVGFCIVCGHFYGLGEYGPLKTLPGLGRVCDSIVQGMAGERICNGPVLSVKRLTESGYMNPITSCEQCYAPATECKKCALHGRQ